MTHKAMTTKHPWINNAICTTEYICCDVWTWPKWFMISLQLYICTPCTCLMCEQSSWAYNQRAAQYGYNVLKPQDSFGEFDKFFSWSLESAGNHQTTPSDLPAIVLNDIL